MNTPPQAPSSELMTCHCLMHRPGKGRDAEPRLQFLLQPQQACTQMVMGPVLLQPAAYAAAAHIDADAWRDVPEITVTQAKTFSYAGKEF